ncbi:hypothetical protein R3W88_004830 [Solanum pinnatisectum]|uniref:Zinc finger GRF-type domain-containing protein n=1 Tax=Solanum pinnatisectum TaxID=50273 RepID=A0AAV9KAF8_9SOLN|nr:hypothetical protein R3W88_004830 [Solanum pinnatisectum]
MSNLSISTSSDANVFCRCGVNRRGGCDYFQWYDDEIPPQAKKNIWGLLKRIKSYEQERKRARKIKVNALLHL